MKVKQLHDWDVSPEQAREIQRQLAAKVSRVSHLASPKLIAGTDLSGERQGEARGAVVVLRYPELSTAEVRVARGKLAFPYVPGLLSFREAPLVAAAWEHLVLSPDLLLVDGQGLAHPRRLGLASHLGLLLDIPTIGCAKSILTGHHGPLDEEAGSRADLTDGGEVIGAVLRTRKAQRPVVVSIGHKIDLDTAVEWVLRCCWRHRLPEPTRLAHLAAAGQIEEGLFEPVPGSMKRGKLL